MKSKVDASNNKPYEKRVGEATYVRWETISKDYEEPRFLCELFKNTGQQDPDIHNATKNVKFGGPNGQECVLELLSRVSLEI